MAKRSLHDRLRRIFRRSPRVNVLRLEGAIGSRGRFQKGISLESLEDAIDRAFSGSRLKAVALVVNSPGGSPAQSALVHDRIRALADEKDVPVVAFVEDAAASGGYWLACAGDEIYALTSSIVGSIGVVSSGFGFVDAIHDSIMDMFGHYAPTQIHISLRIVILTLSCIVIQNST